MTKVMTIVGTRPELIKMSRVIAELDRQVNHVLVHSGQNYDYELNQIFFDELEIRKPDYFLDAHDTSVTKTIANVITRSDDVMKDEQPDAVLLYGDTNSCLAVMSAKRRKIPVFHMEAGNRCFDQRVPEELNRKVLDHLSDINMVLTEHARNYLIAEGVRPEKIIKTGSHMQEVLDYYMPRIMNSDVLANLGLESGRYFVVSAHREENVDDPENLKNLLETLEVLAQRYGYPIIVSTHPRTRQRMKDMDYVSNNSLIQFVKPFGLLDYIKLQMCAFCVLSDSGTIMEESSLLKFPAVMIRNTHERPEGMDQGTLVMAGLKSESIVLAVNVVTSQHNENDRSISVVPDYKGGPVSLKIVRIVISYIDYVNRTTWYK